MRYYTYRQPIDNKETSEYITKSENEIRKEFYNLWYEKMCHKYGKSKVDELYSFEDCLDDWVTAHWAWLVDIYEK